MNARGKINSVSQNHLSEVSSSQKVCPWLLKQELISPTTKDFQIKHKISQNEKEVEPNMQMKDKQKISKFTKIKFFSENKGGGNYDDPQF